jgi:hypothetical protein
MSAQHTPGPWEVRTAGHGSKSGDFTVDEFYVWTAAHDDIALCADVVDSMGHPSEANARLIAAAPDGLAAARQALDECCDLIGTPAGYALEAFVAKATGSAA